KLESLPICATTVEWCTPQLLLGSQLPLFSYRASTATLLFICSGQQKLVTISDFFQYLFSDSFGGNPPLYS
ncbi:hypothetical protein Q2404_01115, partial [Escherichia coli]|nr:hypothetical protein [Escherichia coli]